jgi:peptidoglycan hydrolase-like protein with peptidoglycan-binding domain
LSGTRAIQRRLAELGYKPGPVDGLVGPRTRAAIRAFERDHGLAETGQASPEVIAELSEAQPEAAAK